MKKIPVPTINRLSIYLKCFNELLDSGITHVSSEKIAKIIGLNSAQVRKDLAFFGKFGRRGFGYNVSYLKENITKILGTHKKWKICVIGAGNLGRALTMYNGFLNRGFNVVACFDTDPAKIGWEIDGIKIYSMEEIEKIIKKEKIEIAIITAPSTALSDIMTVLKKTNIKGVLNFAGKHILPQEKIMIRNVDLALELEQLTFLISNREKIKLEEKSGKDTNNI
ncbi:MAG: redox-sensing transcriptional repressor Rex [Candidatus Goldbacteria bacterium]|nr:redox-sensing transcriptional repressor Rex [Candidatus Goldiibacteriota bacterium]